RFINIFLKDYKEYYYIYIDNIIITLYTAEEYFIHLNTIFALFTNRNIVLSLKKLYFGYSNIELLGFYIDSLNLSTTKQRIEVIRNLAFLT
ncbi:hypothetical protein QBC45DRAFT_320840, partial [Copromyces sp. CBS 386.78]